MNDQHAFERIVADTVRSIGPIAPADGTHDQILARVRRTRQEPVWLALAKEPPMRSNSQAVVGSPTMRVAAIIIATLLLAATLAAAGAGAQRLLAADSLIVVAQDGSADHTTIVAAVAAAADGDEVVVRPGTYAESVAIDKSITLRGDGDRDSVIVAFPADGLGLELTAGSEDDPSDPLVTYSVPTGFQLAADAIEVSGLTISGPRPGVAIAVNEGNTLLSDLVITLEGSDADESGDPAVDTRLGVVVAETAEAKLRDSSLDAGVQALTRSSVTVEDSTLTDGGIWADAGSQLMARGNTMSDAGIASDGAWAAVADNTLTRGFVAVGGDGSYRVANNHIDELSYDLGPGIAISIWDGGEVEVTGNRVTNSDTGIKTLFFSGSALIDSNDIDMTRTGISVSGAETMVSNNDIEGSDIIGLEVFSAGPTLTGNSIIGGGTGLHLATPDVASVSDNTICDNTTNVRLVSGEMPDLSTNDICEDSTD